MGQLNNAVEQGDSWTLRRLTNMTNEQWEVRNNYYDIVGWTLHNILDPDQYRTGKQLRIDHGGGITLEQKSAPGGPGRPINIERWFRRKNYKGT